MANQSMTKTNRLLALILVGTIAGFFAIVAFVKHDRSPYDDRRIMTDLSQDDATDAASTSRADQAVDVVDEAWIDSSLSDALDLEDLRAGQWTPVAALNQSGNQRSEARQDAAVALTQYQQTQNQSFHGDPGWPGHVSQPGFSFQSPATTSHADVNGGFRRHDAHAAGAPSLQFPPGYQAPYQPSPHQSSSHQPLPGSPSAQFARDMHFEPPYAPHAHSPVERTPTQDPRMQGVMMQDGPCHAGPNEFVYEHPTAAGAPGMHHPIESGYVDAFSYGNTGFGVPWHAFAQGDMVEGPRAPFSPEYRVRVGDRLTFVYQVVRTELGTPYRLSVGDVINIESDSHTELKQQNLTIMPDGTISVSPLQSEYVAGMTLVELKHHLEARFDESGLRSPRVTVIPVTINLPNRDLRDAVDGRAGSGGQRADVTVTWDGDVWLPSVDAVPVVGLTLREISSEVNARYRATVPGIKVTPILEAAAPSFVYVLGEVAQQGRVEMRRPSTALQAITQAGGFLPGANLKCVVVLRRTADWQLIATKIDLHESGFGSGMSGDDIWLHDTDIVIVPRSRIERVAELVELYFTRTLYSVLPNQGFSFSYNSDSTIF